MNLLEHSFATIGNSSLSHEMFHIVRPSLNQLTIKPGGGLWLTKYYGQRDHVCDWLDYTVDNEKLSIPRYGTVIKLKKDANILILDTEQIIMEIGKKYPSLLNQITRSYSLEGKANIDYHTLSQHYDGVFIDLNNIPYHLRCRDEQGNYNDFTRWDTSTLLLFNLDCVEYYFPIEIGWEKHNGLKLVTSTVIGDYTQIESINQSYVEMYQEAKRYFEEQTNQDYIQQSSNIWTYLACLSEQKATLSYYLEKYSSVLKKLAHLSSPKRSLEDVIFYNLEAEHIVKNELMLYKKYKRNS